MTWVKIDDHFDEHPKLAVVGPIGWGVWLAALAYCNRNLTDGFIPAAVAEGIGGRWRVRVPDERDGHEGSEVIWTIDRGSGHTGETMTTEWVIDLLIHAGLWEAVEGGYQIHDFAEYQPTRAEVEAQREQKSAAGRMGGKRTQQARRQAPVKARAKAPARAGATATAKAPATAPAQAELKPDPDPDPDPGKDQEPVSRAGAGDPVASRTNPDAAFLAEWGPATEHKAGGSPMDNADAWKRCLEAATQRNREPAECTRAIIGHYVAELRAAEAARKHHGSPTVADFLRGPRDNPGAWFNRALDRLDGKRPTPPTARPARSGMKGPVEPSDFSGVPATGRDALTDFKG